MSRALTTMIRRPFLRHKGGVSEVQRIYRPYLLFNNMSNSARIPGVQKSPKTRNIKFKYKTVSALIPKPIPIIDLTGIEDSDTDTEDLNNKHRAGQTKPTKQNIRDEEKKGKATDINNQGERAKTYTRTVEQLHTGEKKAEEMKKDPGKGHQEGVEQVQLLQKEKETANGESEVKETESEEDDYDELEYEDAYSDPDSDHE